MLLAGFDWKITPMDGGGISGNSTAGFHWQVNSMTGCGISGNPTSRISLENKSHGWMWNFQ